MHSGPSGKVGDRAVLTDRQATLIGMVAIALWSFLALLTVATTPVPPLQLSALSFAIGGMVGAIWVFRRGEFSVLRAISWKVYLFGTAGLFGYHFLYFSALRIAPAAEAGLIAYLWPLLIVLFSGMLPGAGLKRHQIIGALIAFAGAAIVLAGASAQLDASHIFGYFLAFGCALTWSGYSVISRRIAHVPTGSVAVFCLASALFSGLAHLAFETTQWPAEFTGWAAILLLGAGPLGLAFFVWDVGMKNGDIQMLGVASYAAPVLSTAILIAAGQSNLNGSLLLAALLVAAGAFIASRDD